MAKTISDEILKLKIIVNSDDSQKRVLDLETANQSLGTKLKQLNQQEKELDKQRKAEEKSLKALTDRLNKHNEKLTLSVSTTVQEIQALRSKQQAYAQETKEYEKIEKQIERVKTKAEEGSKAIHEEITQLTEQQSKFQESFNKASAEYKNLRKEIEATKDAIADNKTKIDDEIKSMDIMNMTIDQLTRRANDLKEAMKHMVEGETLDKTRDELQAINDRVAELNNGPEESGFLDQFNEYIGVIAAAVASVAGFLMKMQEIVDMNNELVDAQTAVAKTTGMTTQEVKELTEAYAQFDTRTSKLDLLKIAEVGGRLGVAKAEIQDFTREVDKAYVALGDSFSGGVEAVAEKIGKIKGLFKETKDLDFATALNQIGSGLNELGAEGAASEENMSDFALRIGQLPEKLKPTIAETLALGGAFEESGIDAERASSGYSAFVRTAAKEAAGFAKVMHLTQSEVERLINEDPLQFFLKFSEGAKGLDPVKLAQILDGLKLNSNEVISIIGAASENTDAFRKSIESSNIAISEATSLQEEFDKVNTNASAIYDKLKKKWNEIYTSEKVAAVLNWIIQTIGKMLGVVEDTTGGVTRFREGLLFLIKILTIATVAIVSYNTGLALSELTLAKLKERLLAYTIVQKAQNLYTQASTTLQNLWNISIGYSQLAIGKLTGATNLQAAAQKRLDAVTKSSPWGAIVALVMAAVTAYLLFKDSIEEAREAEKKRYVESHRYQSDLEMMVQKGKTAVQEYTDSIDNLTSVLKDENSTQNIRKQSYEALIKLHPEFMGTVDKEYRATAKLAEVYSELARQIDISARVKARSEAKKSLYNENASLELEYIKGAAAREKEQRDRNDLRKKYSYSAERGNSAVYMFGSFQEHNKGVEIINKINANNKVLQQYNEAEKKRISYLQEAIKTAKGARKKELEIELYGLLGMTGQEGSSSTSNYTPLPEKKKKTKKTDAEKEAERKEREYKAMREKILENQENYDQKELELEAQKQSALAAKQKEGYTKELATIISESEKKIAELEKQKYRQSDFDDIDKIIAREKDAVKKKFTEIKAQWIESNNLLDATIVAEKEKTNNQLLLVDQKYLQQNFEKQQEFFQESQNLITRQQNSTIAEYNTVEKQKKFLESQGYSQSTLNLITNWEEGKSQIEKYYQKKRLEEQVAFLQEQVKTFELLAEMYPEYLTDEQIQKMEAYRDTIASLMAEIAGIKKTEDKKLGGKLESFGGGNADMFGMTADQWKALFTNTDNLSEKIQKVGAALTVAREMFSEYSNFVQAREQKMLAQMEAASDKKKRKLKSELDAGIISQETYKKETELIDTDLDRKKAELEYKAAKRQRAMQIAQAISGVAMMVINAAQTQPFFPLGLVMTGVAAALGAFQIATILNTPLPAAPGAEDGFYPVLRSQDNKLFKARKRTSKTGVYDEPTMLVGEAGATMPELVVSGKTMKKIDPEIQRIYMNEIRRVEGFEEGLYPKVTSSGNDEMLIKLMDLIKENTEATRELRKYGVKGVFEKSARTGKDIKDMTDEYEDLRTKNQH